MKQFHSGVTEVKDLPPQRHTMVEPTLDKKEVLSTPQTHTQEHRLSQKKGVMEKSQKASS